MLLKFGVALSTLVELISSLDTLICDAEMLKSAILISIESITILHNLHLVRNSMFEILLKQGNDQLLAY